MGPTYYLHDSQPCGSLGAKSAEEKLQSASCKGGTVRLLCKNFLASLLLFLAIPTAGICLTVVLRCNELNNVLTEQKAGEFGQVRQHQYIVPAADEIILQRQCLQTHTPLCQGVGQTSRSLEGEQDTSRLLGSSSLLQPDRVVIPLLHRCSSLNAAKAEQLRTTCMQHGSKMMPVLSREASSWSDIRSHISPAGAG